MKKKTTLLICERLMQHSDSQVMGNGQDCDLPCDKVMENWPDPHETRTTNNWKLPEWEQQGHVSKNRVSPAASSSTSFRTLLSSTSSSSSSPSFAFFAPSLTGTTVKLVGIFTPTASFQSLLSSVTLSFFLPSLPLVIPLSSKPHLSPSAAFLVPFFCCFRPAAWV